jgi:phosphotransferase system HPr-like phosphotransfer protein
LRDDFDCFVGWASRPSALFSKQADAYLTRIIFKLCNVSKEGKALRIDWQMAFDARSAFVVTKLFGVHTRSAGIFHRLRVND